MQNYHLEISEAQPIGRASQITLQQPISTETPMLLTYLLLFR